ncbi:MAG: hypothetical protein QG602_3939 [Verrucomicrobiota bacterium]|nr:hypothetical protein [Verrucomicrobiota bacterium]
MARITIASLQATIVALETQLAEITRERDGLLVAQRPSRSAPAPAHIEQTRARAAQAPRTSERPISDYRRACEQARAMAMATGRSVKVG